MTGLCLIDIIMAPLLLPLYAPTSAPAFTQERIHFHSNNYLNLPTTQYLPHSSSKANPKTALIKLPNLNIFRSLDQKPKPTFTMETIK